METTTQLRVRVPMRRMKKVRGMLGRMGLDAPGVINLLFAQIELRGRLPFDVLAVETPNAETQEAMREVEDMIRSRKPGFDSASDFMASLKAK